MTSEKTTAMAFDKTTIKASTCLAFTLFTSIIRIHKASAIRPCRFPNQDVASLRNPYRPYLTPTLFDPGHRLQVKCNGAYANTIPYPFIVCQTNGTWTDPHCRLAHCSDPEVPENGRLKRHGQGVYGNSASLLCDQAYRVEGAESIFCRHGHWTGPLGRCAPIRCRSPVKPEHGDLILSGYQYGDTAQIACHPGYRYTASKLRMCVGQDVWNGTDGVCVKESEISCEALQAPANGHISGHSGPASFGNRVTFTCNEGYKLEGSDTRECMANGTWCGIYARCSIVRCPTHILSISHGTVNMTGTYYNDTVLVSCELGYNPIGPSRRWCQANGQWSGETPSCQLVPYSNCSQGPISHIPATAWWLIALCVLY